jgi:hypothetical protein
MNKNYQHRNRIDGYFTPHLVEMVESPAWSILSRTARQILDYCEIKLARRWEENGRLIMTHDELIAYGVHRNAIAPAIRELVALGFIEVTEQGRAGNAEFRRPTKVRVTYLKTRDAPPAHEWRHITENDATMIAKGARRPGSNSAAPKKQNSTPGKRTDFTPEKRTETQYGKRTESVEKRTENFSTETVLLSPSTLLRGAVPMQPDQQPTRPQQPAAQSERPWPTFDDYPDFPEYLRRTPANGGRG